MDYVEPHRKILYSYAKPFRNLFNKNDDIEKFDKWFSFKEEWKSDYEDTIIVIPLMSFDLIGLDIRYQFREFGNKYEKTAKFLLVGTERQIEFALSQNDKFLKNMIDQLILPLPYDVLEASIMAKVNQLERTERGKRR